MDLFIIFGSLYAVLILLDLIPTIRKKEKKVLFFSIPVYLVTLAINMMIAADVSMPNLNHAIRDLFSTVFHI